MQLCRWLAVLAVLASTIGITYAQPYPSRPIRWIIDFPPGGPSDALPRVIGQKLNQSLGQPIVYDNRPGANGVIAYGLGARAPADGYTLVVLSTPFPLNAAVGRTLTYDTLQAFAPITMIADFPNLLFVNPSVPARSVQEFVTYAKTKSGNMTYASSGSGSVQHLAMELFRRAAGFDAVHVPYAGSAPALLALVSGQVDAGITNVVAATPHLRVNKLRVLGVLSASRTPHLPDVPTLTEAGFAVVAPSWIGVAAPKGTPPQIVNRLNVEIARIINLPDVRESFASLGAEPHHSTPAAFSAFIRSEVERWTPLVKQSGARIDN